MKRLHMTTLGTLAAALVLAATACGGAEAESAGPVPTGDAGSTPGSTPGATDTTGSGAATTGDETTGGRRYRAAAVRLLLEGPTAEERRGDVASAIPSGTRLLGLDINSGTATVDLTSEFESGGGSLSMTARLAQVVYTLTEFDTVKRVRFALDGEPVDVFSGEGIVLDQPVGRDDYAELLPPISVEWPPLYGRRVSTPVHVEGTANVFEANVTARLLDRGGKELVSRFTTATCGNGCRGRFAIDLPYQSAVDQSGTLVLQDDDADGDGKPHYEVRIPVTLSQG
jgi:germination protein M